MLYLFIMLRVGSIDAVNVVWEFPSSNQGIKILALSTINSTINGLKMEYLTLVQV